MQNIRFEVSINGKRLVFSTETNGLIVSGTEYQALDDGVLIYDKTKNVAADEVICQLSSNTSTLIPTLRILGIPYNKYFDTRDVIESQNDITFYWKPSKLAAFYNRYTSDRVDLDKRKQVIREAVEFLLKTADVKNFLPDEYLKGIEEDCVLLGFYEGFPIFDAHKGLPQLKSRLGIHIGIESTMVSTPLDKYAEDVVATARKLEEETKVKAHYKKNRVRFEKSDRLLKELGLK